MSERRRSALVRGWPIRPQAFETSSASGCRRRRGFHCGRLPRLALFPLPGILLCYSPYPGRFFGPSKCLFGAEKGWLFRLLDFHFSNLIRSTPADAGRFGCGSSAAPRNRVTIICGMGVPPVYLTDWKPVLRDEHLDTYLWGTVLGPIPPAFFSSIARVTGTRLRHVISLDDGFRASNCLSKPHNRRLLTRLCHNCGNLSWPDPAGGRWPLAAGPLLFPASELAPLYHMRWDIETFYRDFKHTLRAMSWHCQSPRSFHQELLVHMIALCLIRIAMLEASCLMNVAVAQLSFARALTETRLLFKLLVATADVDLWPSIRAAFVLCCARHRVHSKPGRQFSRDRQEYRRNSRGLENRRPGRRPKSRKATPLPPAPETRKDSKGNTYLLS